MRRIRIMFAIFSCAQMCIGLMCCYNFINFGLYVFQAFKLSIISSISSSFLSDSDENIGIRLLWNGCSINESSTDHVELDLNRNLFSESFLFHKPVRINGFALEDKARNILLLNKQIVTTVQLFGGSLLNGSWTLIGGSNFRAAPEGIRVLDSESPIRQTVFDFRPPWPLVTFWTAAPIISALGFAGAAALSAIAEAATQRQSRAALRWLCMAHIIEGIVALVSAAGFVGLGLLPGAFSPASHALTCWCLAALGLHGERLSYLAKGGTVAALGLCRLASAFVEDRLYADTGRASPPPPLSVLLLCLGPAYLAVCWRTARQTMLEMAGDCARFESAWAAFQASGALATASEHSTPAVSSRGLPLSEISLSANLPISSSPLAEQGLALWGAAPRRRTFDPKRERLSRFSQLFNSLRRIQDCGPGPLEYVIVTSLDQLYSQAFMVVEVLDERCRLWGSGSGGVLHYECSPVPPRPGVERVLAEGGRFGALRGSRLEGWLRNGCIKDPARAIRKARVCYGGDVSRLLDVCRHRLFFDTPEQMEMCVRLIRADTCVDVLRIRGGTGQDGRVSRDSGFRVLAYALCNFLLSFLIYGN